MKEEETKLLKRGDVITINKDIVKGISSYKKGDIYIITFIHIPNPEYTQQGDRFYCSGVDYQTRNRIATFFDYESLDIYTGETDESIKILENMSSRGTVFVKALAECFYKASKKDYIILKNSFPNYWEEYANNKPKITIHRKRNRFFKKG